MKSEPSEITMTRLALLRQDGLLAACFDQRPTSPVGILRMDPFSSTSLSHNAAMDHMIDRLLRDDILADELENPNLDLRRDLAHAVDAIKRRTQGNDTNRPKPTDIQNQCQILHLDLQFGFVKGWICRPALRNLSHPETDSDAMLRKEVTEICLQSLRECLYAFVRLNSLCNYASRSWSVIHNGLSSSLLLALTGGLKRDSHLHAALGELLDMFETNQDGSRDENCNDVQSTTLSPAYTRAVVALRKMYTRDKNVATHESDAAEVTGGGDTQGQSYTCAVTGEQYEPPPKPLTKAVTDRLPTGQRMKATRKQMLFMQQIQTLCSCKTWILWMGCLHSMHSTPFCGKYFHFFHLIHTFLFLSRGRAA